MNGKTIKIGDIVKITDRDCLMSNEPVMSCHQKCGCRDENCATVISKICNLISCTYGIKFNNGEICAKEKCELILYELDPYIDDFFGLCPQCDSANIEPTRDFIYDEKSISAKATFTCYNCDYDFEVELKDARVVDKNQ